MDKSWVIQAIEREAMAKARRELAGEAQIVSFMGLAPYQIQWLILDYRRRTGRDPSEIEPSTVAAE